MAMRHDCYSECAHEIDGKIKLIGDIVINGLMEGVDAVDD